MGAADRGGAGAAAARVMEEEALKWLLRRRDIAEAVDLYLNGQEAEALPAVLRAVRAVLAPPPGAGAAPPEALAASGRRGARAGARGGARGAARGDGRGAGAGDGGDARSGGGPAPPAAPAAPAAPAEAAPPAKRRRGGAAAAGAGGAARAVPLSRLGQLSKGELQDAERAAAPAASAAASPLEAAPAEAPAEAAAEAPAEAPAEAAGAAPSGAQGPSPLYWKIDLPEVSRVLLQRGILPDGFQPTDDPHVTLLYVGGEGSDWAAAKRSGLSLEEFQNMRAALEELDGQEFEVRVREIVIEESVACAVVSLPPTVPCVNTVPHVTLGIKLGVPPRYANDVLEEVKDGRTEGVFKIPLPAPRPLKGQLSLQRSKVGDE